MFYNPYIMCGISGISEENVRLVEEMISKTSHRGPDDRGVFSEPGVTLGHCRLSIQDLSYAGHQPMKSSTGRYTIVFNGEIYNFKKLRDGIKSKHKFISGTDTEVILELFEEYGLNCLNKISGIYAFGIWDSLKKELILCRDNVGVKPLYYAYLNGSIVFSSEMKSLYSLMPQKEININALNCYFRLGYVTGEETIWQGIKRLLPGNTIIFSKGEEKRIVSNKQISIPNLENIEDAKSYIPKLLKEVLEDQMISDVPVGLFLSGGIDSNLLLSLMSEISDKKINTYSSLFRVAEEDNEKFNSDAIYARKSSEFFDSNHTEINISEQSIIDSIEDVVWHMDEPNSNSSLLPNYLLAKKASINNKVILSGEGGDEIFGGYDRYRSYRMIESWRKIPSVLRNLALPMVPRKILNLKNKNRLNYEKLTDLYLSFASNSEIKSGRIVSLNIKDDTKLYEYLDNHLKKSYYSNSIFDSLINAEINSWLVDDYLMRADKMSMSHGIENRVPFLDERLIQLSRNLKSSWKYPFKNTQRGKQILIDSMAAEIPDFLLNKPKKGCVSPISKWLIEVLKDMAHETINKNYVSGSDKFINFDAAEDVLNGHINRETYGAQSIWSVITFQIWYKKFIST